MVNREFRSPVYSIIAVPFEKIVPNTYNPNNAAAVQQHQVGRLYYADRLLLCKKQ